MKRLLALVAACAILAATSAERQIVKEVVVKAPVDAVFKAWSTSEGLATFFAPEAKVEARSGGPFEVYMNPYAPAGMKGADGMVVMAVQPGRMISFTWNAPPSLPEVRAQRTLVIVRTEAAPENQTKVTLTHVGWGDGGQWDQTFAYFDRAWGNVLANLQKRFAEDKPVDWTEWLANMRRMTDEAPKKKPG
jgi:uncharacterized protein YndB with AHSA1/START domain